MKLKHKVAAIAAASALALTSFAAPANAVDGEVSLATALDAANQAYDSNWSDFDILTAAVNAVLTAKPTSDVAALTDGSVALTAFAPTDRAFRKLVKDLTGDTLKKEKNVFAAVAGLGIDTVEAVLLYHVIPGTVDRATALGLPSGTEVETVGGGMITIRVGTALILRDMSPKLTNPKVILNRTDINGGNKQIAHAIDRVLLPIALAPAHSS